MKKTSKILAALFLFGASLFISWAIPASGSQYDDLLEQSMKALKAGKVDEALSKIREIEALNLEGGLEMAHFIAGNCHVKKNDNAGALSYFQKSLGGGDFVLRDYARYSLARTYEKLGAPQAAAEYEKMILDEPTSALAPNCLFFLAKKYARESNHKAAIELYDIMVFSPDMGPLVDEAKYYKGKSLEALKRNPEAVEIYYNLVYTNPKSQFAADAKKRIAYLVKTYRIQNPVVTKEKLFARAAAYYDKGDYGSASSELYRFLKSYPSSTLTNKARLLFGISEYKNRRYRTAEYNLRIVAGSGLSGADEAQFYLSFVYGLKGNLTNALASLNKVMTKYPTSQFVDDAAYYTGYYLETNGYLSRAMEKFAAFLDRYPKSNYFDDAVWRLGRYHYYRKDYERAYETFGRALTDAPYDDLTAYCAYWQGMAALRLQRQDDAKASFLKVVKDFDHSYQSYRARERLKELGLGEGEIEYAQVKIEEQQKPEDGSEELVKDITQLKDSEEHLKKYEALLSLGFVEHALNEAAYLIENSPEEDKAKAWTLYYFAKQQNGEFREPLVFAENRYLSAIADGELSEYDLRVWQLAYPKGFWASVLRYSLEYQIDPYLVLAVIREESRFNPAVVSWAKARGLMQIIPSTGLGIARLIGIRPYYTYRLFEPDTNVKMGCYYLSNLLKRFNGNPYLALTAYNGGPIRVKTWLMSWNKKYGEVLDIDEFVELIPFRETRRYVQKVMKSYNEYRRIYESKGRAGEAPGSEG